MMITQSVLLLITQEDSTTPDPPTHNTPTPTPTPPTHIFTPFSLPPSTEELREHFTKFGDIESINVKTDPNTGRSRGFAFIVFNTIEAIDKVSKGGEGRGRSMGGWEGRERKEGGRERKREGN